MLILACVPVAFIIVAILACLKVASDSDDKDGI